MRSLHKPLLLLLLLPLNLLANPRPLPVDQQLFIETYAKLAVEEMRLYGVPASITLAQAIVESGWGQGKVFREGRNMFCIKCFNGWNGPFVKAMDDEQDSSCFRLYQRVELSFRDHSVFLRSNQRYRLLFDYEITDYKSWAKGLKTCGYATKEDYAEQLIALIENYALYLYDYAVDVENMPVLDTELDPAYDELNPAPGGGQMLETPTNPVQNHQWNVEPFEQQVGTDQKMQDSRPAPSVTNEPYLDAAPAPKWHIPAMIPVPAHNLGRR